MVSLRTLVVSTLVAVATAKSAVIDLIPSNFDDVVLKSGKPTLVEFFAPWCGHCKNLAPIYEELASAYEFAKDKVQIAKVDADAERALGQRFKVQGFPTLKWFDGVSDQPQEYQGARNLEALSEFVEEKSGVKMRKKWVPPSSVQMLTDVSFTENVGGEKGVLVAFTAPWCGHCKNLAPIWEKVADDFHPEDSVIIAKVDCEAPNSKALAKAQGINSYPIIKWFPAGSIKGELFKGARTEEGLLEFVNEKQDLHRTVGGGLDPVAGTLSSLDQLVVKLSGGSTTSEVLAQVKAESAKLSADVQKKSAEYYARVLTKLEQNHEYVKKELSRLQSLLSKDSLDRKKRDEITIKANILKKFEDVKTAAGDAASTATEKANEAQDAASEKAASVKDAAGKAADARDSSASAAADATKKASSSKDATAEKATDAAIDVVEATSKKTESVKDEL